MGLLCLVLSNGVQASGTEQFSFSELPQEGQLYPRNLMTNEAVVSITGFVKDNQDWGKLIVHVYEDQQFRIELNKDLQLHEVKTDGSSNNEVESFYFSYNITAGLHNYHFFVIAEDVHGNRIVLKQITNVVAGDAYIIQGQSNAEARQFHDPSYDNESPFIRVLGCGIDCDEQWYEGQANSSFGGKGNVGQWGMKMAKLLVDYHQVPVAIFNGAHGDKRIAFFQRNDQHPTDQTTNYGRLLTRVQAANFKNHIRGVFWSQGENNGAYSGEDHLTETYKEAWMNLYNDWKMDFPAVEKMYILQTRQGGCGSPLHYLTEAQRQLANELEDVEIMSSNNTAHDGCHFHYEEGYEWIGERMYHLLSNDLYNTQYENVEAPNMEYCYWVNDTAIAVVMKNPTDVLFWEEGTEKDFRIEGIEVPFVNGYTVDNILFLQLAGIPTQKNGLSYVGHGGAEGPWITNANGVGLINFFNVPIQNNRVALHIKVYLEGVYNPTTDLMETPLITENILPYRQPFANAPWNYQGNEEINKELTKKEAIVDWLLIELRDALDPQKIVMQRAALLLENGQVLDAVDQKKGVYFPSSAPNQSYYVVIRSRNHLDVMSKQLAFMGDGTLRYDFTKISNVKSGQVKTLNRGIAGLYAGDLNADGVITVADLHIHQKESTIIREYVASDCNLDAIVSVNDFNQMRLNMGLIAIPEVWYELD